MSDKFSIDRLLGAGPRFARTVMTWYSQADQEDRDKLIDRCFLWWREQEFPHYQVELSELKSLHQRLVAFKQQSILHEGDELTNVAVSVKAPTSYHPHRLGVQCGSNKAVLDSWDNDKLLRRMIRVALQTIGKISASTMRTMAATASQTQTVANFLPATAKFLYETFSKPGDRILDPSAGYGGRAFGLSTLHDRHYVGIDPTGATIEGNEQLVRDLQALGLLTSTLEFIQSGAEVAMPTMPDNSFDFIFTSPPYFNIEKYDETDPNQSSAKFPEYEMWVKDFLGEILRQALRLIKPGKMVAINIANVRKHDTEEDVVREAMAAGFALKYYLKMRISTRQFSKSTLGNYRFEPIFVFQEAGTFPTTIPWRDGIHIDQLCPKGASDDFKVI